MGSLEAERGLVVTLRARFRGAFVGCRVGDAIGRPFEKMSARDIRLASALRGMLDTSLPFRYTDDSEMMMAMAESLVRTGAFLGPTSSLPWRRTTTLREGTATE